VLTDYTGPSSRRAPDRGGLEFGAGWAYAPKYDGCYARVSTDRSGVIRSVLSRAGRSLEPFCPGLVGLRVGLPDAVVHGELEAHTEAGIRAATSRGWAALHLFDATRLLGRPVTSKPYSERYGALHRWQAEAECYGEIDRANWWETDDTGRAHDPVTKRFVAAVPRNLRRLPIAPLVRGRAGAEDLWQRLVVRGEGCDPVEGLVAVRLDAPLGRRGAKVKIKQTDQLDATVVQHDHAGAVLSWRGHQFVVSCTGRLGADLSVGAVVAVDHDGWYESGVTPRFARIVRVRHDLAGPVLH
jgi:hypothetical protein